MGPVRLSRREREVAALMAEGFSYSEIAVTFGCRPDTVRKYAHRMAGRLPGRGSPVVRILLYVLAERRTPNAAA